MLGSLILYLKGMRRMMFQLSRFYYRVFGSGVLSWGKRLEVELRAVWGYWVSGVGIGVERGLR